MQDSVLEKTEVARTVLCWPVRSNPTQRLCKSLEEAATMSQLRMACEVVRLSKEGLARTWHFSMVAYMLALQEFAEGQPQTVVDATTELCGRP